jgi:vacuolar protein sorting-associated protein 45
MSDLIQSFQNYVWKILGLPTIQGMKALLMDAEATRMVGIACSLTDIINKEVFLVEKLQTPSVQAAMRTAESSSKSAVGHLNAVCIVRPTKDAVDNLCAELTHPRFKEYHVFFTGIVSPDLLRTLAAADAEYELVRQVQEYYCDYFAVTPTLFTASQPHTVELYHNRGYWRLSDKTTWQRNLDAVSAVLLAHKRSPVIRYSKSSELARMFGADLSRRIKESDGLFTSAAGGGQGETLLLLLDRKDDPVTPLLQCWLYQAMVHERLNITDNRVDLRAVPNIPADQQEIVLSAHQDRFFSESMHLNFGELGAAVKRLVTQYQAKMKTTAKVDTIEDMQNFVDKYPEFREMSGTVSKHMTILGELSRQTNLDNLMVVSEAEQDLACSHNHSAAVISVQSLLEDETVKFDNKLNLVLLYALRYETEKTNQTERFKQALVDLAQGNDRNRARVRAVEEIIRVSGARARGGDLFNNKSMWARVGSMLDSNLRGIENVFTRHKPLLSETVDLLAKGKLKARDFPTADGAAERSESIARPTTVYVYILGGATYEESAAMHIINKSNELGGLKVILGGSCVHNSKSYVSDLLQEEEGTYSGNRTAAASADGAVTIDIPI